MSKNIVPCGGFELDKNFLGMNKNGELSLAVDSEGNKFKQLVTDGDGKVEWEDRICYDGSSYKINGQIYDSGHTQFCPSVLTIDNEMWQMLLSKDAVVFREDNNATYLYENENAIELVYHTDDVSSNCDLLISKSEPKAYFGSGLPDDEVGSAHNVVIRGSIKQIDPKFIPKTEIFEMQVNIVGEEKYSCDKTFAELQEAVLSGKYIHCVLNNNNIVTMHLTLTMFLPNVGATFVNNFDSDYVVFTFHSDNVFLTEYKGVILPYEAGNANQYKFVQVNGEGDYVLSSDIVVPSSTSGSSKKFKITVNDSGTITATEVTT